MGLNGLGDCKASVRPKSSSAKNVAGGGRGKSVVISVSLIGNCGGEGEGGGGSKNTSSSSCNKAALWTSWRLDSDIRREGSGFVWETGFLGRVAGLESNGLESWTDKEVSAEPQTLSGCGGDGVVVDFDVAGATELGKSFSVSSEVLELLEFCLATPDVPDGLFWFVGPVSGKAMESRLGWHSLSPLCQSRVVAVPGEVKGQGSPTEAARPDALCALGRSECLCRSRLSTGACCWKGTWFSG